MTLPIVARRNSIDTGEGSLAPTMDAPITSRTIAGSQRMTESASVPASSPEGAQISAILRQIDVMWEAIAHLRQTHFENTPDPAPSDQRSEIGTSLPDYATVADDLEDGRSTPQPRP